MKVMNMKVGQDGRHLQRTLSLMWVFAILACVPAVSATGSDFTWEGGSSIRSFGDPANWSGGAEGAIPGENDNFLHGNTYYYFDLDGKTYTIGGLANGFKTPFSLQKLSVENGKLILKNSFDNRVYYVDIKDTGHFELGANGRFELGDGGQGCNRYDVRSGGTLTIGGEVVAARFVINVEAGGTLNFNPSSFYFLSSTYDIAQQAITNAGSANFPSGLTLGGTGSTSKPPSTFTIRQNSGTITLGGPLVRNGSHGQYFFSLAGGTLAATGNVSFSGLDAVTMDAGAAATVDVDAGCTLDLSTMSFGTGSSLVKSGSGTLTVGRSFAAVLSASAGSVRAVDGAAFGSGLTLASGATLTLAGVDIAADAIDGLADAAVELDETAIPLADGVPVFVSGDAALMATVAGKLTAPTGWIIEVRDGAVRLYSAVETRSTFASSGEAALAGSAGWTGDVPSAGDDVVVRGEDTVAILDVDTPAYASITVQEGATLKITGTLPSFPPVALKYSSKLLLAEDSSVASLPAIAAYGSSTTLPVVEIATNATVAVTGDEYRMTNVHLRLFGNLDVKQNFDFGWADAGSTTFFGLTVDGAMLTNRTSTSYFRFMCPESGGRVIAPNKMVFRRSVFRPLSTSSRFRTWIGYRNPLDAPFTLEVDDCFLDMRGNAEMYIGGAATVACVNGGGLRKTEQFGHPGLYMKLYIQDKARLTFDDESYFLYTFNRYPITVNPNDDGHETFVFRNGSRIGVHTLVGNGKAIATFEDSWWDVLQLSAFSSGIVAGATDSQNWKTNAFHGLKAVNVPEGKFVGIRSADYWPWGIDWNREILLDPEVPITGGGSLMVTNAAPGWSMRAIVACGSNTATGEAWACPSDDGCQLVFDDGANWAGTVVGDENVAFTNRAAGTMPAAVDFGAIRFAGGLPVRVWRSGTNDFMRIAGALSGTGGIAPVTMDGEPVFGDSYVVGSVPLAGGEAPDVSAYAGKDWKLSAVPSGDGSTALLRIRYAPKGIAVHVR